MVGGWGELLVEHCTFQNRNPVRVFLYHCISDGNQLFSENFGYYFYFISHIMSDKAAFVSGALFCVQCYRGNLELSRSNSASRWQRINLPSVANFFQWKVAKASLKRLNVARWRHTLISIFMTSSRLIASYICLPLCAHILYFHLAKFSIKLFSFI